MTGSTTRALEYFNDLRDSVNVEEVRMSGAWSKKAQRGHGLRDEIGTGEGPYVESVEWRWDGAFESSGSLVGIAILVVGTGFYWVKSHPPVARPAVSFSTHGWAARPCSVHVTGTFHGAFLPSAPAEAANEPPESCLIGPPVTSTGTLHVVGRLDEVAFGVVLLPASVVKVGRNRLWQLRENIAAPLRPELQKLMTKGRSGKVRWDDAVG